VSLSNGIRSAFLNSAVLCLARHFLFGHSAKIHTE
jgi:hypothetical protein